MEYLARAAFNEVHSPCCAYHYADIVKDNENKNNDINSMAKNCIVELARALEAVCTNDKSTAVRQLYRLAACALCEIDNIEERHVLSKLEQGESK